jgi:hypothetical protein
LKQRRMEPFCLVVADRDQKVFTVEGPMTDDAEWNDPCVPPKRRVEASTVARVLDLGHVSNTISPLTMVFARPAGSIVDVPLP